jgi:hypothetical protein
MLTLLPGVIFPPISYCIILHQYNCVIDGWGFYHKQSIRNHFQILSANGPLTLTLPVKSVKGKPTPLNQVELEEGHWYKPMLTAIQSAYGKSPFYFYFKDELTDILSSLPGTRLFEAQIRIMQWLEKYTGLPHPNLAEQWDIAENEYNFDLRKIKKKWEIYSPIQSYHQVFMDRFPFREDLSILDLLFNLGPQAKTYIAQHAPVRLVPEDHQSS